MRRKGFPSGGGRKVREAQGRELRGRSATAQGRKAGRNQLPFQVAKWKSFVLNPSSMGSH